MKLIIAELLKYGGKRGLSLIFFHCLTTLVPKSNYIRGFIRRFIRQSIGQAFVFFWSTKYAQN